MRDKTKGFLWGMAAMAAINMFTGNRLQRMFNGTVDGAKHETNRVLDEIRTSNSTTHSPAPAPSASSGQKCELLMGRPHCTDDVPTARDGAGRSSVWSVTKPKP
jgi:hypothetical protein